MEKSNLIRVARTMTQPERRRFGEWLRSPIHNKRDDVVKLWEYLAEDNRLFEDPFLEKTVVFPWVHGRKTEYSDALMRQTMHFFTEAAEEFLAWENWRVRKTDFHLDIAEEWFKRHLNSLADRELKSLSQLATTVETEDATALIRKYRYENLLYRRKLETLGRSHELNLQDCADALDAFFLSERFRQGCLQLSHQTVFKTEYDTGLLASALAYMEERPYMAEKHPAVGIYYYAYKALADRKEEGYFNQLRDLMKTHIEGFPLAEKRDLYLLAINYGIGKINTGAKEYLRVTFELFREGLFGDALMENGILTRWTYRNIATIGLNIGEFDWVDTFIEKYRERLPQDQQESAWHFCRAKLLYEKKDYKSAMQMLAHVEYDEELVHLTAKTMLLKMYYETGEFDALDSLLSSMSAYLRRKKVPGFHHDNYRNIIRLTQKLIRLQPGSKSGKIELREEIGQATPLTEKAWFLAQL